MVLGTITPACFSVPPPRTPQPKHTHSEREEQTQSEASRSDRRKARGEKQVPMRSIFRRKADERTPMMSDIEYKTADQVVEYLRSTHRIVIIDVREDDRAGGHIKGSHHIPAPLLRTQPSRYVHLAQNADFIVFHCMFSQCRGPSCAAAFQAALAEASGGSGAEAPKHKVVILAGGFQAFAKLALAGHLDLVEDLDRDLYA